MNDFTWEGIWKFLAASLAPLAAIFKIIDKYFERQANKDQRMFKEVAKEMLEEVKEDLLEIRKKQEDDARHTNQRIDQVILEIRKK